jgi:ribosomal protein S8
MLYTYNVSYVINLININKLKKNLHFNIFFTKKNLLFINFLKNFTFINKYYIIKIKNKFYIRIYLYYYKNKIISNNFKILSSPSKSFFLSYKSLRLISKRTSSSIFILSTDRGLLSHKQALNQKLGGLVLGFFSI